MKYLVTQKYYDTGRIDTRIDHVSDEIHNFFRVHEPYDEWGDVFNTFEEAQDFEKDAKNA